MRKKPVHIAIVLLTVITFGAALSPPGISAEGPLMWGFALDGYPVTKGRLSEVGSATGLKPDLVVFFLQWPQPRSSSLPEFPLGSLDAIWKSGAIPCVTWEPMYHKNGKETTVYYKQLLHGDYDHYISQFALQARSWGKPLLVRFAHEMNIKRYHWGTPENEYGPESPDIYKKMYRHVVDLFRQAGAHNVLWVFCPNAESVPNISSDPSYYWNVIPSYYPGDSYVDIIGIDGYNWGTTQTRDKHGWDSSWKSFREIFETAYRQLRALVPEGGQKPFIVFETATVSQGGDRTQWIREALEVSRQWGIKGIVWFQSDKELDWRINSGGGTDHIPIIKQSTSASQGWARELTEQKAR